MSTNFNDPVVINTTGAKTASLTSLSVDNDVTSSTASVDKIGVSVVSTGSWSGTSANNYGVKIDPTSGGTNNYNIWSGPTNIQDLAGCLPASQNVFTASTNTDLRHGLLAVADSSGDDSNSTAMVALQQIVNTSGSGATGTAVEADVYVDGAGNQGGGWGVFSSLSKAGSGTLAEYFAFEAASPVISAGSVTTAYGLKVNDLNAGTNYGIHTNQTAAANSFAYYGAGTAKSYFGGSVGIGTTSPASRIDIADGALTMQEMTAPSSPASNKCVIYAEDNGSGKTRLMVKFATGAAQQIQIEP